MRRRLTPLRDRHAGGRSTRGVAAVELALLLMPLVLITFGATEIGRAIYTYNTLDKTVRDATRYLSQHGSGDVTVQNQAACLAVYGNTTCTAPALAPGLTVSNVSVCDPVACPATHQGVATGLGTVNLVSISIGAPATAYTFSSLVSFVFPSLNFNSISCTMRAQL
ncbi:TadE/TadG family type IV pilus assembly protein [Piscinibacter sp. XHJ-5]|uniref:TadE/TadG family type IV pilus assembly protein n=1 Tax=Piscinibacter sp. XHJ-5 TaxID=3037797 RepID=UPI00245326B3|nr:TadE/TadG family type IV pilus assembly protein [Piscinibacter sp. XHJ-5]